MIRMSEEYLRSHWAKEESIKLRNKTYRVGKMSYGDYFLELSKHKQGENVNGGYHYSDTLWPEKELKNGKYTGNYIV